VAASKGTHKGTSPGVACSRLGGASRILAAGFGATTLMWLFSYLAILIPSAAVGEFLFGLAILSLVGGGWVAGRGDQGLDAAFPSLVRGVLVGFVSAMLNLLVVISLLRSEMAGGVGWIIGILLGCLVAGGIGGLIGSATKPWRTDGNWLTVFCWVAAGLTFFMIVTGGVVTGFEAGLAVPDWPNSYGHNMLLYPLSEMVADPDSGVFFEHAHRLTGMFVGMTAIVLCIILWMGDTRTWVGMLGLLVLVLVIAQGVLGGLRVTGVLTLSQDAVDLSPSTMLAIVHGVLAQVVLAIMAVVAAVTSTRWRRGELSIGSGRLATDRQLAVVLLVCLLIQLILGAAYRHLGTDLGTRAPAATHALLGHIVMAVLVVVMGVFVGLRGASMEGRDPVFVWLGRTVLISIGLQILLGIGAVAAVLQRPEAGNTADVPAWEVLLTSAHQANGAVLLAVSLLMVAWYQRVPSEA
jgi:cytochrome c oxidase assembly protein subunit 15